MMQKGLLDKQDFCTKVNLAEIINNLPCQPAHLLEIYVHPNTILYFLASFCL
jgi:hypothetical protein